MALHYVGEAGGIEEELCRRAGVAFTPVETGQVRGRSPLQMGRSLARMRRGAAQAAALIRRFRPDVMLLTGGYVTAPVAWAAWRARPRVPALIYLPDLTPGLAVRLTSRFASRVAVTFPEVAAYFPGKAVVTGYPVRQQLWRLDRQGARAHFRLEPDLPVLLIFGGSRGSRSINRSLVAALPELLPHCQILHITGQMDWPSVQERLLEPSLGFTSLVQALRGRYHAYPYLHEEMMQALGAADLVVARAGASVLGEFPALGLPSILVPYPYAGKHQDANARYLAERGAAVVVPDASLAERLAPAIAGLISQPERLAVMASSARVLAQPGAASRIAAELRRLSAEKAERQA